MNVHDTSPGRELAGEIDSQLVILDELHAFLMEIVTDDVPTQGKTKRTGLIVAGILENYYTAAETILFRIAQEFGNEVDPKRWHSDLLERTSTAVPEVRPAVLRGATRNALDELRRFRHFKRYYYRVEYDWDKLDFLIKKENDGHALLRMDLIEFRSFLMELEA
ncbi:MAG: hypothetical protein EA427_17290 [Spirochaetaceae bacterium]|nr:MAG: hypothetical protein EA427_17290 [Spirochaetaceae bacterium]